MTRRKFLEYTGLVGVGLVAGAALSYFYPFGIGTAKTVTSTEVRTITVSSTETQVKTSTVTTTETSTATSTKVIYGPKLDQATFVKSYSPKSLDVSASLQFNPRSEVDSASLGYAYPIGMPIPLKKTKDNFFVGSVSLNNPKPVGYSAVWDAVTQDGVRASDGVAQDQRTVGMDMPLTASDYGAFQPNSILDQLFADSISDYSGAPEGVFSQSYSILEQTGLRPQRYTTLQALTKYSGFAINKSLSIHPYGVLSQTFSTAENDSDFVDGLSDYMLYYLANLVQDNPVDSTRYTLASNALMKQFDSLVIKQFSQPYNATTKDTIINPALRTAVKLTEAGKMSIGLQKSDLLPLINASGPAADVIAWNMMKTMMLPLSIFYVSMRDLKYGFKPNPSTYPPPVIDLNGPIAVSLAADNIAYRPQLNEITNNLLNDKSIDSIVMNGIQSLESVNPGAISDLTLLYQKGTKLARTGVLDAFYPPTVNKDSSDEARVEEGSGDSWGVNVPSDRIDNFFLDGSIDGQPSIFVTKSDIGLLEINSDSLFLESTNTQSMQSYVTRKPQISKLLIPKYKLVKSLIFLPDGSTYTYYQA